jgi:hypothetical protein
MIDNSYYSQEMHGPYELHDIGNLDLEEGGTIRGCRLAYATFGTLNAAKDNAILIPTWYSGTNKIIEQVYIAKGRALDPDKYFIIIVNQIGNGLSTSPHNTPVPAGMGNFPDVRIGAVEIDGENYWDGGYSGNPTITPLVRECTSKDTILVQINPVERPGTPKTARDILNRLNEVSFNSVLLKELRMIALLRQVADPGDSEGALWAGMRIHRVTSEIMVDLGYSSKLNAEWDFLCMLRDAGRSAADSLL